MKRALPVITYQDVRLRPLAEEDLPMTLDWRNRERARVWFKNSQTLTHEQHAQWFERYTESDTEFMFVIAETATGKSIGQIGLYNLDEPKREVEIGRFVAAPSGVAPGLMTQGVKASCDWLVRHFPLERIYCEVFSDNAACLRVTRAAGFQFVEVRDPYVLLEMTREMALRADSSFARAT